MNEQTFLHELQQVKRQVSTMMNRHQRLQSPSPSSSFTSAPPLPQDIFSAQMNNLKAHLAGLDYHASAGQSRTAAPTDSANRTMPSGPLFWQLFTSLRSDVQRLDGQVASLEQGLVGLEDQVAALPHERFTPPSSADSSDDGASETGYDGMLVSGSALSASATAIRAQEDGITASPRQNAPLPSPESETAPHKQYQRVLNVEDDYVMRFAKLERGVEVLRRNANTRHWKEAIELRKDLWHDRDALHARIQKLEQQRNQDIASPRETGVALPTEMDACTQPPPAESTMTLRTVVQDRTVKSLARLEGVAFRDKEIARLDELLRESQQSLRYSEHSATQTHKALADLKSKHEQCDVEMDGMFSTILQKHQTILSALRDTSAKEGEITKLHATLSSRHELIEAWSRSYQRLEREYQVCQSDRDGAMRHVQRLQRLLHEAEDRRDENAASHADDISRFHDFSEKRDAIADKQEAIIARGAALLRQRDDEIESLMRRLQHRENDVQRGAALLKQRDDEIVGLTTRLQNRLGDGQRGAAVLKQRDDEIKGLARRLQDRQYEEQSQVNQLAGLLRQSHAQSTEVSRQLTHICEKPKQLVGFGSEAPELRHRLEEVYRLAAPDHGPSFADIFDGRAKPQDVQPDGHERQKFGTEKVAPSLADRSTLSKNHPQQTWSPQPIVGLKSLADELRRVSVWASELSQPVFGQPSVLGALDPSKEKVRADGNSDNEEGRRIVRHDRGQDPGRIQHKSSSEHVTFHPDVERNVERAPRVCADDSKFSQRRGQEAKSTNEPRIEQKFNPEPKQRRHSPLLAPIGPHGMRTYMSHADMRSKARKDEMHRPLSKHQSVPEFPRMSHIATVESDVESTGKGGA